MASPTSLPISGGRFLRMGDLIATTGLSRPTIYRLVAAGDFPRQHSLTKRCVGWWQSDVDQWLRDRRSAGAAPPP